MTIRPIIYILLTTDEKEYTKILPENLLLMYYIWLYVLEKDTVKALMSLRVINQR